MKKRFPKLPKFQYSIDLARTLKKNNSKELAKLSICALMSTESQLIEDVLATSKILKDDLRLEVMTDE